MTPTDPSFITIVDALKRFDVRTLSDDVWRDWQGNPLSPLDCQLVAGSRRDHREAARQQIIDKRDRLEQQLFTAQARQDLWLELIYLTGKYDPAPDELTGSTVERMEPDDKARANEVMLLLAAIG